MYRIWIGLDPHLIMGGIVNRDFEPVLANSGDTVNVPLPATTMTTNNIAEGARLSRKTPTWATRPSSSISIPSARSRSLT